MNIATEQKNWMIGAHEEVLKQIHEEDVNIAIHDRAIDHLKEEVNQLVAKGVQLRASGTKEEILAKLEQTIAAEHYSLLLQDIELLFNQFQAITGEREFRFLLATIDSNMCRKFHTDMIRLRMLCTYHGQGTLWLKEENVNRDRLHARTAANDGIVIDETKIEQVKTGATAILKGAMYANGNTKAIVHRSPTIEECREKRLFLRIDLDDFINF